MLHHIEQGYVLAQNNLGVLYKDGRGTQQNYKRAFYWYTKAAEQGHSEAQKRIGVMYDLGKGVPQNYLYAYAISSSLMEVIKLGTESIKKKAKEIRALEKEEKEVLEELRVIAKRKKYIQELLKELEGQL